MVAAPPKPMVCPKCQSLMEPEHDGVGWTLVCRSGGHQMYDKIASKKNEGEESEGSHLTEGPVFREWVTLEEALEHPSKRYPDVRFEVQIYCWLSRPARECQYQFGNAPPRYVVITGKVETSVGRYVGSQQHTHQINIHSLELDYNLDPFIHRERVELRNAFRRAIQAKSGFRVNQTRGLPVDVIWWHPDAPSLIELES